MYVGGGEEGEKAWDIRVGAGGEEGRERRGWPGGEGREGLSGGGRGPFLLNPKSPDIDRFPLNQPSTPHNPCHPPPSPTSASPASSCCAMNSAAYSQATWPSPARTASCTCPPAPPSTPRRRRRRSWRCCSGGTAATTAVRGEGWG